jgi:hypothetical protein
MGTMTTVYSKHTSKIKELFINTEIKEMFLRGWNIMEINGCDDNKSFISIVDFNEKDTKLREKFIQNNWIPICRIDGWNVRLFERDYKITDSRKVQKTLI